MTAAVNSLTMLGEQAVNREGNLEYKIVFAQYKKGGFVVRKITTSCTYGR